MLAAQREQDTRFGRKYCMECGGSLEVGRYTAACQHCMNRLSRYRREQRRNGDIDRLGQEIEGCG